MATDVKGISVAEGTVLLQHFQNVFDIARFVDPVQRQVLILHEDGTLGQEEYFCYKVWNKVDRCENCISVKAQCDGCRGSKYEFIDDSVFQVVATPFTLRAADGTCRQAVLELVNNATDEIMFEAFGKPDLIEKINLTNKKIYQDSLTQVHNRRYFDERVFCYAGDNNLQGNVVFVMVDLKRFKSINDTFGHETGDLVLSATGAALTKCVRTTDAVIRMGGDEFLVVLKNCHEDAAEMVVEKMRAAVEKIVYNKEQNLHAVANFGWAAETDFAPTPECIARLLEAADNAMYIDKRT